MVNGSDNRFRHPVLKVKDVGMVSVIPLGPDVVARRGINQLGDNTKPVSRFADTALQDIPNAKVTADVATSTALPL